MTAAPDIAAPTANPLNAFLSDRMSERMKRATTAYMLASVAVRLAKQARSRYRDHARFTVAVAGDDELYPDLNAWLLLQIPEPERRALVARYATRSSSSMEAVPDGGPARPAAVALYYDGRREQTVTIDGHRVTVATEDTDSSNVTLSERSNWEQMAQARRRIVFTASSGAGRAAIIRFIEQVAAARSRTNRPPRFRVGNRWGHWNSRDDAPLRSLDTVVLAAGQRERIVADIAEFLAREGDYVRVGVPWHRGYLLHGEPGTGKTSAAKALASHFGLDVHFLPLADIDSDTALYELVGSVPPRSMLLIEDIDVVNAARARNTDTPGVTLTGLLNALDGITTPHGLIVVMTTNHREVLDEALIRPGRVDLSEHIGLIEDRDHMTRLVHALTGLRWDGDVEFPLAPATVVDVLKRHLSDPPAAVAALDLLAPTDSV